MNFFGIFSHNLQKTDTKAVKKTEAFILSLLPKGVAEAAKAVHASEGGILTEVHLRANARASISIRIDGKKRTLPLTVALTQKEMRELLARVCDGSVYAFEESLKEGFVTLADGIRVGVGGRMGYKNGSPSLSGVSSLCFRIPHRIHGIADELSAFFKREKCGILLFAPPSGGKTTLLREVARTLSRGEECIRCAVVDTRGEFFDFEEDCLIDRLSGYPKARGAEIAVRTLAPELLVMDELGREEREALLSLSSLGVPVIASVHGESADEVLKSAVSSLFERGVFSYLWDIRSNTPVPRKDTL